MLDTQTWFPSLREAQDVKEKQIKSLLFKRPVPRRQKRNESVITTVSARMI